MMIIFQRRGAAQQSSAIGIFGASFPGFGQFVSTTAYVILGSARSIGNTARATSASVAAHARSLMDRVHGSRQEPQR
jgi:hypothetical protein